MPESVIDNMDDVCRAAYEAWIVEARGSGRATFDDAWLAARRAGRASVSAEQG